MNFKQMIEEAKRCLMPDGARKTCMIQNKYSREYTDYYLNQLADFFNFDFFQNKKEEIVSNLKENQKFKSMREVIEDLDDPGLLDDIEFIIDSAKIYAESCEDKEESKKRFEDMMFFDSLIMNNKRNIDNFGFIVDVEDETKKYKFVCFYDKYNSIFDHLNGIDEENYYNVIKSLSSWIDNDVYRHFILSTMAIYVQQRHIDKIEDFLELNIYWKFQNFAKDFSFEDRLQVDKDILFKIEKTLNELEALQLITSEEKEIELKKISNLSIYDFHIQRCFEILPGIFRRSLKRQEFLEDPINLEEFLINKLEYEQDTIYTQDEMNQKLENLRVELTEKLRQDPKINKNTNEIFSDATDCAKISQKNRVI